MTKATEITFKNRIKQAVIRGAVKALPKLPRTGLDFVAKKIRDKMEKYYDHNPDQLDSRTLRYQKSFVLKTIDVYLINSKRLSPNCRYKLLNNLGHTALLGTKNRIERFEREEGFRPPSLIVISPTMRCNLQCTGCYAFEYNKTTEGDIPFDILVRILEEARSMGIAFIVITGGEPYVRKDELLQIFQRFNDMYFITYTNGQLIDKKLASELEKVGNVAPCISVEGYDQETDARRGSGVHERVLQAMMNLKNKGVPFAISVTVTRNNAELVTTDEFFRFYEAQGALFAWYFQYMPIGRNPDLSLIVTPEQRNNVRRSVLRMREGRDVKMCAADFWGDAYLSGGCLAGGRAYIHISGTGWIEPCVFTHFAVHNIKDTTIREALRSKFMRYYREKQNKVSDRYLPCGIIDYPENLRQAVHQARKAGENVRETHPGAESIITTLAPKLDRLAKEKQKIVGEAWKRGEI